MFRLEQPCLKSNAVFLLGRLHETGKADEVRFLQLNMFRIVPYSAWKDAEHIGKVFLVYISHKKSISQNEYEHLVHLNEPTDGPRKMLL